MEDGSDRLGVLIPGGLGGAGPEAEGEDRHSLLPTSCCPDKCPTKNPLSALCPSVHRVKEVYRLEEMEKIFVR